MGWRMWRNNIIHLLLLIALLSICRCGKTVTTLPGDSFVAFSLREAQSLLSGDTDVNAAHIDDLGGITRLLGMVIDRETADIILIGKKCDRLPEARFEDFVVALRSRFIYDDLPMVSIDPVPSSSTSGLQEVRFGGHIEHTAFGHDFLENDILLKTYSLELKKTIDGALSYRQLILSSEVDSLEKTGVHVVRTEWIDPDSTGTYQGKCVVSESVSQSRFWFVYKNPYKVRIRNDVFCIMSLDVVVKSENTILGSVTAAPAIQGSEGSDEQFARLFSEYFYRISSEYESLKRLKLLFDMTAVAEGLKNTPDIPDISFLLKNYTVPVVETKDEYPLIKKCAVIHRNDGKINLIQLSGGLTTSIELQWLNGGDVGVLLEIVKKARPRHNALFWDLPLSSWEFPNSSGISRIKKTGTSPDKPGCSVMNNSVVLEIVPSSVPVKTFNGFNFPVVTADKINTKGVKMAMMVMEDSFREDHHLDSLRESILNQYRN